LSSNTHFFSGVGGLESGLFASELYSMYENYAATRGWSWNPIKVDFFDGSNAIRYATVSLHGPRVYTTMKFEAGVHRVQRNPVTDPSRIHTSTMSIVVMPESSEDVRFW
jgi:peptide chain release factor 1